MVQMTKKQQIEQIKAKVGDTIKAAENFIKLRDRTIDPNGKFDSAKRWYPTYMEPCCAGLRSPSAAYPYSLLVHCRTAAHVAYEFCVNPTELKRIAKQLDMANIPKHEFRLVAEQKALIKAGFTSAAKKLDADILLARLVGDVPDTFFSEPAQAEMAQFATA